MTPRFNLLLLAVLVLVGLPAWWWLLDNPMKQVPPRPVSISTLRDLAGAMPGSALRLVVMEVLARREEPATLAAAGSGLRLKRVGAIGYALPVPGRGPVVIDPEAGRLARASDDSWRVDKAAAARMNRHSAEASVVLRTRGPGATVQGSARAVAPGVVAIPAAGMQMIFVRLADGREVLFAGDIAPHTASWLHLRSESRWRSHARSPEVRREMQAWLRTVQQWSEEAPGLVILPGRDVGAVRHLVTHDLAVRPGN